MNTAALVAATTAAGVSTSVLDLRSIITARNDAVENSNSANLCRRSVVVRDGADGFKSFKLDVPAISQQLLVGRAQLWSTVTNSFEFCAVLLDSLSEVTMAVEPFFSRGVDKGAIRLHGPAVAGGGANVVPRVEGVLKLKVNLDDDDYVVVVECVRAPVLPRGAGLLLSAAAASQLGIISLPLSERGCNVDELPELDCMVDLQKLRDRGLLGAGETTYDAVDISPTDIRLANTMMDDECDDDDHPGLPLGLVDVDLGVTEADFERILEECVRDPFVDKVFSIDDVTIGIDCSPEVAALCGIPGAVHGGKITVEQARAVRRVLENNRAAFATGKFPAVNKREPVRVELEEGGSPHYEPPPKAGPAKKEYLYKQMLFQERHGGLVDKPHSAWCYRLHTVFKGPPGDDDLHHDLRSTDDAKGLNRRSKVIKQQMPDGPAQLDIAAQKSVCTFHTDAASAYTAFAVDQRDQEKFTCWWPSGPRPEDPWVKKARTRMPFGWSGAAQVCVEYYNRMKASLPEWVRATLAAFFDDHAYVGTTTFGRFLEGLDIFLKACIEWGVWLAPWKTFIALRINKFWGFSIDGNGGAVLSDRNLRVIREMKPPSGAAEVQSLIGAWTQNRRWIPMFSDVVAPLTDLTRKGVAWQWGQKEQGAFEEVKRALLESTAVYKPNYEHQLICMTDASDYGAGSNLLQRIDGEVFNIGFYSRKFSSVERGMPTYFRELTALVEGVKNAEVYALSSSFPLRVETDHQALQFTRYVDKGPLSAWAVATIGHINIEVVYVPAAENGVADFLSRYQLLGRNEFSVSGFSKALSHLLKCLAASCKSLRSIWFHAFPGSSDLAGHRQVQQWRTERNALMKGAPVDHILARDFDLAILAPATLKGPLLAHQLLKRNKPFAMLLPTDLLEFVPQRADGVVDSEVRSRLQGVHVLTLGGSGLVWIVFGVNAVSALCLGLGSAARDGSHSDWTDSSSALCGATLTAAWASSALADIHPESSASESESDEADEAAPPAEQAAVRHAAALPSRKLKRVLESAGQQTSGSRTDLIQRVAVWLGPQYAEQEERRQSALKLRQQQSELHRDVPFYDVEGYHSSKPGETRFIVDQLLTQLGPVASWATEQLDEDADGEGARRLHDNVLVHNDRSGSQLVVVPLSKRELMLRLLHEELGHNTTNTASEILKGYYWPKLRSDVDSFLDACPTCKLNQQRVVRSHKLWRAREYHLPRSHYSMDIKRVAAPGYLAYVLVVVDRFSGWATCVRMNDKQTDSVIAALTQGILYQFGPIAELSIDAAKEFESKQMDEWAVRNNVVIPKPLAYNAQANAASERFWRHYNARMQAANDYPGDQESDKLICWEWNIQRKRGTGFSPFEIMYGSPVVTRALNRARGVHTVRAPTAEERTELEQCLQQTAATITGLAARRANTARRSNAIDRNIAGVAVLPDLLPGEKCMFYQPASGGLVKAKGRSRSFVPAFSGPATVLARMSNVGYWLKGDNDGRYYYRHRAALRKLPARSPIAAAGI